MTHYHKEITRIKKNCFSNQNQLETVIGTRHFISNHFDRELNLELLSHIRLTSKFHLLRLYKRYYGQTPKQFLTDKRLEQSKKYLKKGNSVTQTCYEVGFDSPASFSTLFKSRFGLSPTSYQRKQFSQSREIAGF